MAFNFWAFLALSSVVGSVPTISRVSPRAPDSAPLATTLNGSYYGTHSSTYNEDLFLGIPFAQPPLQDLRFKNPQTLNSTWSGALPATNYAWECIGYGPDQIGYEQSEDCLYLNVVRPSGYENASLPVAVWIHGGGFAEGGAPDRRYNLSFIVENSVSIGKPIIGASIAYRLGPIGFLNGDAVANAGALNLGLKDQRLALQWINENIAGFGGDPTKVTIWGESAGASSVGLQLLAFNGRDDGLFRAGMMESGNPIFEGPLNGTETYQARYDALVAAAGCSNSSDSLQCLRELPFFVLNNILNTTDFNNNWNPALDGDFIARLGSEQLADGSFVHVPIISGANSDEGTAFGPVGVDTIDNFIAAVNTTTSAQYALPESLIQQLVATYFDSPDPDYLIPSSETLGGNITLGEPYGMEYRHSAAYWGDEVFIAARRLTVETWAAANISAYSYRFNAIPTGVSWPIEVTHFQEVAFVFNNLNGLGYAVNPFENKTESYTKLSELMSKSWASFVYDLDPNGWTGRDASVPAWPAYSIENPQNIVWDANVTSFTEPDTFRAEGIKLLNENWGLFVR
ncbi:related to cholinesterase [Phialocephala subalpina]|uniref:Carboxylic ester hydrolase n=1 Tax=Phialocephala subalpina TaxID=576137 RepID=A0A1L7XY21_9HELO|nr:related to cholinesterase [Phialocephala subalpina]